MPQSYYDVTSYKYADVISVLGRHVIQALPRALQWQKVFVPAQLTAVLRSLV